MKISKKALGTILFGLLAVLFLYMAGFFTPKLATTSIENRLVGEHIETVEIKPVIEPIISEYSGTVIAQQSAILSARLTARVAEILVEPGNTVKQGDVLLRLESSDLDAKVIQNQQSVSAAQAQLNAARKDFQRVKELVSKKLLPQSEFDKVDSQLKTSNSNFKQAQASVLEAQTTFGYSIITAPFDGVITSKTINTGDTASVGSELMRMYNPNSLQLQVDIPESVIAKLTMGEAYNISIPTFHYQQPATLEQIEPAADSTSRSFVVKFGIETVDIYPGSYGKAKVIIGEGVVLRVPDSAVYQIGQLDYVDVVQDKKVIRRIVQLGEITSSTQGYRVRQGLSSGDNVVLNTNYNGNSRCNIASQI